MRFLASQTPEVINYYPLNYFYERLLLGIGSSLFSPQRPELSWGKETSLSDIIQLKVGFSQENSVKGARFRDSTKELVVKARHG